jgi:hypothetical protein
MWPRPLSTPPSLLSSFDKTVLFFIRTIEAQMEGAGKLAEELRNLVRQDMLKFSNEVKNSLTNVYKDLKGM